MKKILYICAIATMVLSCAKSGEFPLQELSLVSFQQWMADNAPTAEKFDEKGEIYIKYYQRGAQLPDSLKITSGMWFDVNYTGYTLDGSIFATRDSLLSRVCATWANTTHWVDDYLQYYGIPICEGVYDVLPKLNTGDSVRLYFSKSKAFLGSSLSINSGYAGETATYTDFPCYMDLRVGRTTKDPAYREWDSVKKYALKEWGQSVKDTIMKEVFMRKIKENPKGDSIGQDSTIRVWYAQNFLDGFLIKTNSDSIAAKYSRQSIDGIGTTLLFKPNSEDSTIPKLFLEVVKKMRRGEVAEFLITSKNSAQGMSGDFSSKPQVLPYAPTIYTITVLTKAEEKAL